VLGRRRLIRRIDDSSCALEGHLEVRCLPIIGTSGSKRHTFLAYRLGLITLQRNISWLALGEGTFCGILPSLFVFYSKHNPDETSCEASVFPYSCLPPNIAVPESWSPSCPISV
jgi:hypothetical protein